MTIPQRTVEEIVHVDEETITFMSDIHDFDTAAICPSVYSAEVITIVHVDLPVMGHE